MASGNRAVTGVFTYLDDALKAIEGFKRAGLDLRVYSPVPCHEVEEILQPEKSPVRFFTATGAVTGLVCGFTLAICCSLDYPMRVSAKDIVSVPGFVVIGYECTILFGAIFTLLALLHFCRLPNLFRRIGYDPRFSDDKFGVVVCCAPREVDDIAGAMKSNGADEVTVQEAL